MICHFAGEPPALDHPEEHSDAGAGRHLGVHPEAQAQRVEEAVQGALRGEA